MKLRLGVLHWSRSEPRWRYRSRRRWLKLQVLLVVGAAVGLVLINLALFSPFGR